MVGTAVEWEIVPEAEVVSRACLYRTRHTEDPPTET